MSSPIACFACGAPLEEYAERRFRCSNPNCPGKEFVRCGYCKQPSLAIYEQATECFNPGCRLHQIRLTVCADCGRPALMSSGHGSPFCIFRGCPSNADIVQDCAFCGSTSFLRTDGVDMCTRSICPALLKQMSLCPFCSKWMVDTATSCCQNQSCEHFDQPMMECGSCGQNKYSLDLDQCLNESCPSRSRAAAEAPPTPTPPASVEDELDVTIVNIPPPASKPAAEEEPSQPAPVPAPSGAGPASTPAPGKTPAPAPGNAPAPAPPRAPDKAPVSPTPAPTATPQPAPRPAPGSGAFSPSGGEIDLAAAFRLVREGILSSGEGAYCPLLLVMGTAGAGKTAFLATLGKILREGADTYAFPYPGVESEAIDYNTLVDLLAPDPSASESSQLKQRLRERIGDLVTSYSQDVFDGFIAKGIWCAHTERDCGQFLVANVTKRGQPVANIVTLETSGENFKTLLKGINDLDDLGQTGSPIVSVMVDMLRQARGLVILMDPSVTDNDQTYGQFFAQLKRHLGNRVHVELTREINERLEKTTTTIQAAPGSPRKPQIQDKDLKLSALEAAKAELTELEELCRTHGAWAIESQRARFQRVLVAYRKRYPKAAEKFQANIDENPRDLKQMVRLWLGVLAHAKGRDELPVFAAAFFPEHFSPEGARPMPQEQKIARQVCMGQGVDPETAADFDLEAGPARLRQQLFPHLRDIALVFSKSDMHPVVHPPDAYPRLKLPASAGALERSERYLRFLGGDMRYYNTSVLGYSVNANGQFFPGNDASLTPVNVIEPVFDMLSDKLERR